VVPEAELGAATLARVELRDDAGNSKIFDNPGQF
jgi:hypothetical protein